jgi:hypothetical protein
MADWATNSREERESMRSGDPVIARDLVIGKADSSRQQQALRMTN